MKILVLTDSLSLPRAAPEGDVFYEDTYIYKLKKKFTDIEFLWVANGGATMEDIYKQIFYYKVFKPDLFIIHCGIVDCAPRPFRRIEIQIIKKLRIEKILKPLVPFLRKYRNLRYTSPKSFEYLSNLIKTSFEESTTIYAVGILPSTLEYENILPGITKSSNLYNQILKKHFNFIDNSDFPKDSTLNDHHHLNAKGHQIIYEKIEKAINKHL